MKRIFQTTFLICMLISPAMSQIKPGTSIRLSISGVPAEDKAEFDTLYPVYQSGKINLPLLNLFPASGKTAEQLARAIEQAYKDANYYTNPTVQVITTAEGSDVQEELVTVGGNVRRNGSVKFRSNLTIYQAIQEAGGPDDFGSMERVELLRGGKYTKHNLTNHNEKNLLLKPGDTITVPQKNIFGK